MIIQDIILKRYIKHNFILQSEQQKQFAQPNSTKNQIQTSSSTWIHTSLKKEKKKEEYTP